MPLEEVGRLFEEERRRAVLARFRELGYLFVSVDLAGFQSGSANLSLRGGPASETSAGTGPHARRSRPGEA